MTRSGQPMLAVVDLDGVLADVRHRLHHVSAQTKDWGAFFAAAPDDPVLEEGRRVVEALAQVHEVVYLSGRPEMCRTATEHWLVEHGLPQAPVLLRPFNDRRPARMIKVEALDRLAEGRSIAVLVDDDPLVLDAARAAGYDVLPAPWMGDLPALHEAQEVDGET